MSYSLHAPLVACPTLEVAVAHLIRGVAVVAHLTRGVAVVAHLPRRVEVVVQPTQGVVVVVVQPMQGVAVGLRLLRVAVEHSPLSAILPKIFW